MSLTALGLLNKVLRGLRRDVQSSTTTTDSYQLLILQYLNSAKEEIEDGWDWHALRQTITVTVSASTSEYALTAAGPADVDVTERSRLLYEKPSVGDYGMATTIESSSYGPGALPQVFDVTDSTEYRLTEVSPERMERLHFTDNGETGQPELFALYRDADNLIMKLWPTPSGSRTIKMRFVIPQTDIPSTSMTGYQLLIDSRAVWTKALHVAAQERGEDTGRPASALEREAQDALFLALDRERLPYTDNSGQPI
jgi:hypothetical protein